MNSSERMNCVNVYRTCNGQWTMSRYSRHCNACFLGLSRFLFDFQRNTIIYQDTQKLCRNSLSVWHCIVSVMCQQNEISVYGYKNLRTFHTFHKRMIEFSNLILNCWTDVMRLLLASSYVVYQIYLHSADLQSFWHFFRRGFPVNFHSWKLSAKELTAECIRYQMLTVESCLGTNICYHLQPSAQMSTPVPYCPRSTVLIIIIIVVIIHPRIKVTLSQKCCRATVQTANVTYICSHSNSYSYNWCSHVPSSLKDALNSSDLICRLNAMYDSVVLTDTGRAFQARAAVTGNARLPSVVRREANSRHQPSRYR